MDRVGQSFEYLPLPDQQWARNQLFAFLFSLEFLLNMCCMARPLLKPLTQPYPSAITCFVTKEFQFPFPD
jgi:hypothetical protein